MAISETQKVDYLWKKLGYGLSKTDTNANKRATNESIASPLLLSGDNVWAQADQIPATIPGSSSGVVTVYPTSSPDETTADTSATTNRTWKTGLTDWISPEFGSTYLVKAYIHTAGDAGNAASAGTQVFGAGSGNDDEWFFDYQSGLLHFIGTNLPNGVDFTGKSLYISGARYTGIKGVAAPGAGVTFSTTEIESLKVSGLSTFTGAIDANGGADISGGSGLNVTGHTELDSVNVSGITTTSGLLDINAGGQANTFKVEDLTDNHVVIAGTGGELEGDANLTFDGSTFVVGTGASITGFLDIDAGINVTNAGSISTFQTVTASSITATSVSSFSGGIISRGFNNSVSAGNGNVGDIEIKAFHDDATVGPDIKLYRDSDSPADADYLGQIKFAGNSDTDVERDYAKISAKIVDASNTDEDGALEFSFIRAGSESINALFNSTELQLLNGTGLDVDGHTELDDLNVAGVSTFNDNINVIDNKKIQLGSDADLQIYHSVVGGGSTSYIDNNTGPLYIRNNVDDDDGGNIIIEAKSGKASAVFQDDEGVRLYYNDAQKFETTGIGISVSNSGLRTAYIEGPEEIWIDPHPAGVGATSGSVRIRGDLYVDGTEFIVDVDKIELGDFNIGIASTVPTNLLLDGAGLGIGAQSIRKTITWNNATSALMSSENWNLASGKHYEINGTDVLTSTTLGSGVVNSSLTNVGTLTELNVNGIATATTFSGALSGNATSATNLAGGDTGDIPYQSAANTTTFVDASSASVGQVLIWGGSAPAWAPVSAASGNFGGITLQEEGSTVGTAGSISGINFKGNNVTASAPSGVGIGIVTVSDTPTFDSLNVTGISTIPTISGNVTVGTGITFYASTGIISATAFYGSGENLTDLINQRIEGLQILDGGTPVGTGYSFSALNFIGNGVSVAAVGLGTTANITIEGFGQDADGNMFAGDNAGGTYDPSTGSACFNISVGCNAGKSIVGGSQNTFLGCYSGGSTTSGSCNVFMGARTGLGNTDGVDNVFLGHDAGCKSTTGSNNVFLGHCAGNCNTGSCNVNIGYGAACLNKDGTANVFLGAHAGFSVEGSVCSVYIGHDAGRTGNAGAAWDPQFNVLIGDKVGYAHTSICNTILIGPRTGWKAGSEHGISMGYEAGMCDSGEGNIALGRSALGGAVVSGCGNIAMGCAAGFSNTSGSSNAFLGVSAGRYNISGIQNVYIGEDAGYCNNTGDNNIAIGRNALRCARPTSNNEAETNVAIGVFAGSCVTTGCHNLLIGTCKPGFCITTGGHNTIIGRFAGHGNPGTGMFNVFMGACAGMCFTSGEKNVIIGDGAGCKIATGQGNAFLGHMAGRDTTVGDCNVFIGRYTASTNQSGCCNIAIGPAVELPSSSGNNQLAIGSGTDRWITGDSSYNISVNGVNATGIVTATDFNSTSDARLKTNIQAIPDPLDKIVRIDGVSFNWIENNRPSMGVIADNIQEVLPELVSDTDPKTVNYNGLIGLLIEVVKDQQTQINSLNERLSQLE